MQLTSCLGTRATKCAVALGKQRARLRGIANLQDIHPQYPLFSGGFLQTKNGTVVSEMEQSLGFGSPGAESAENCPFPVSSLVSSDLLVACGVSSAAVTCGRFWAIASANVKYLRGEFCSPIITHLLASASTSKIDSKILGMKIGHALSECSFLGSTAQQAPCEFLQAINIWKPLKRLRCEQIIQEIAHQVQAKDLRTTKAA